MAGAAPATRPLVPEWPDSQPATRPFVPEWPKPRRGIESPWGAVKYYESILDVVGNTPLVRLHKVAKGLKPVVLAKLEQLNPGGSVKDRIGLTMIEEAERTGQLRPGATIVEPTCVNTGQGLAMVAAIKGYKMIFVMPDKMSDEKISLLKAYGADVVVCPTNVERSSPQSYYSVADRLAREVPGAFQPNQYFNPRNPEAHYATTGPEIWDQTDGRVDVFVAGMGTGGTISGVLFPDPGRNYLSKFFNDEWMRQNGYLARLGAVRIREILLAHPKGLPKLVTVEARRLVGEAIDLMQQYGISQLPVVDDSNGHGVIGTLQERSLLDRVYRAPAVVRTAVSAAMDARLSQVGVDSSLADAFEPLLRGEQAVLVVEGGKPIAMITRADLLEFVAHRGQG